MANGFDWGSLVNAGIGLAGSLQNKKAFDKAAKQATPTPFNIFGPAGGMRVDPRTNTLQLGMADNPFASMFSALGASSLANAATAPGSPMFGADPEIRAAYEGLFGQGLTDRAQEQLGILRQAAAPDERRAELSLDNQLFARGQLGTTGGTERFGKLQEVLQQADLQRQLQSLGLARQEGLDRFSGAVQGVGQGMAGQLQNFNIGQGAFGGLQQLIQNLFQQSGLGIGASTGVPPQLAAMQAQAAGVPWQAGANFLQNSGAFDALNRLFQGGGTGGVPMVPQPTGPINVGAPNPASWMPSGNFGL